MATISAPNLVKLRTKQHKSTFYLSVLQPATLLTASVNGAHDRGARSIAYNSGTGSGFSSVTAHQTLEIDTAVGTKKVRIKSITGSQTSGTITIDENGIDADNAQTIRVKRQYDIWGVPPRIASGVFYKFYDTTYSDQNSQPSPVAIAGPHRAGFLSSGSIVFSINASSSYAIANGATISTYAWTCTGGTIASASSASTTITFTQAGQYWLKLVVTDSNGKTQETYRSIWVYDDTTLPFTNFTISGLSGDWTGGGWQFTVQAHGDSVTLSGFPDGALCLLWHKNYIDGAEDYVNVWGLANEVICCGYIRHDSGTDNLNTGTGEVSFTVTTPEALIDNISLMASVSLNAKSTVDKWWKYATWLTTGRAIHHLLRWHSTVLQTCDVLGLTTNTLGVKNVDFTETSLLQMINGLAYSKGIGARMVSDRLGRLHLVEDSQLLGASERNALDTVFSITTADVSQDFTIPRQPEGRLALGHLDGFSFNGTTATPFVSLIPGYRESGVSYSVAARRGSGATKISGQIVADQSDANERLGRFFAVENNEWQEIRQTLPRNYLGAFDIVPSLGWYEIGLANAALKRELSVNGLETVCRRVDVDLNVSAGTIGVGVVLEVEAEGEDAVTGNYPSTVPTAAVEPDAPEWEPPGGGGGDEVVIGTPQTLTFDLRAAAANRGLCKINDTDALLIFQDGSDFDIYVAVIREDGDDTFTEGTPVLVRVSTGFSAHGEGVYLEDNKCLIVYWDNSNTYARIVTTGGTMTPTLNTEVSVETGGSGGNKALVAISSTKALYTDIITNVIGRVLDVSGTTITVNSQVVIESGGESYTETNLATFGSDVLITYNNDTDSDLLARSLYSITTTFSVGSPLALEAAGAASAKSNCFDIGSSKALVAHTLNSSDIHAKVVSNGGSGSISTGASDSETSVTLGTQTGESFLFGTKGVIPLTDTGPTNLIARTYTLAGDTPSFDGVAHIIRSADSSNTWAFYAAKLTSTLGVLMMVRSTSSYICTVRLE